MAEACIVKVFGLVTRLRDEDGARVPVPFGHYTMESLALDRYRFSGEGLPTFELNLTEVATYMGSQMKVIEGRWP